MAAGSGVTWLFWLRRSTDAAAGLAVASLASYEMVGLPAPRPLLPPGLPLSWHGGEFIVEQLLQQWPCYTSTCLRYMETWSGWGCWRLCSPLLEEKTELDGLIEDVPSSGAPSRWGLKDPIEGLAKKRKDAHYISGGFLVEKKARCFGRFCHPVVQIT